jgi:hypothetical protein
MIGKYVERFIMERSTGGNKKQTGQLSVDMQFLEKTGLFDFSWLAAVRMKIQIRFFLILF